MLGNRAIYNDGLVPLATTPSTIPWS